MAYGPDSYRIVGYTSWCGITYVTVWCYTVVISIWYVLRGLYGSRKTHRIYETAIHCFGCVFGRIETKLRISTHCNSLYEANAQFSLYEVYINHTLHSNCYAQFAAPINVYHLVISEIHKTILVISNKWTPTDGVLSVYNAACNG